MAFNNFHATKFLIIETVLPKIQSFEYAGIRELFGRIPDACARQIFVRLEVFYDYLNKQFMAYKFLKAPKQTYMLIYILY